MSGCDMEMCSSWTGHGCACELLDIERRPADCPECGSNLPDEPWDVYTEDSRLTIECENAWHDFGVRS